MGIKVKKQLTLEQKIDQVLRHYWMDNYAKEAYYKNCTKAILKLITELKEGK